MIFFIIVKPSQSERLLDLKIAAVCKNLIYLNETTFYTDEFEK